MKIKFAFYFFLLFSICAFTIKVNAQYFVAPFGTLPDPNIVYYNGWYYYTGTSGNGVYLKKARTLEGLKHTTMTRVFSQANGGPCCDYWAPELHKINNVWYIHYTARDPNLNGQRTYVIENTSSDPMTGTWTNRGKIYDAWADYVSIDGTILETGGQYYYIWSGIAKASDGVRPQHLYIARMTNPWTLQPGRVLISSPTLSWEQNEGVNEGPAIIKNNGKIFLTYSANACWTPDYLIAALYMNEGNDPMNAASWTKMPNPLFTKFAGRDVYAPGHHAFFTSPDGTETWFVYHATPNPAGGCDNNRTTRAQKVYWDANGFPSLGLPEPTGAWLTAPSGEPALPVGATLANGIYKITPMSSNKPLDVNGCSPMPGTKVQQWTDNGADCQKWHIIATLDGYYSINSVRGGLALDVEGCSAADAAGIQMWNPTGADCQKWTFVQVSPGVYRIVAKNSGKVLDVQFGGNNDGAKLQIYSYLANAQQHFKIELLQSYNTVSWESYNFPTYIIRHQNGRARIDNNVNPMNDGKWRMVPGLAGQGVSFQSVNFPGNYLRHINGEIWSNANDGSQIFRADATFIIRPGLADVSKVSFESYNFPGNYIRHRNYLLYSEPVSGTGYSDATFNVYVPNIAPTVSITSPANNATFIAPATINIAATAADADGTVSKVEFFNGTTKLGEDLTSPYSFSWANVAAGSYTLTAKATDNAGTVTTSTAITIVVNVNQAPTVNITSPANNATFIAPTTINIAATAADADGTVSKVEFFNGTTKLGEDLTSPYSFSWTNVAAGTYTLTAKATDNKNGITTSTAVTVTVSNPNQAPTVSITSPANNATFTAPATINIAATAADADGTVSKVEFFNGTTKLGEDLTSPYTFSWTNVAAGSYTLTAKATDNAGTVTTSTAITIVVNANQAPTVSIISPANNATFTAPATINIASTATDADGTVSKVEFFNGTTKLGEDLTSPYTFSWTNVAAGTYTITAKASDDKNGSTTSSGITVVVNTPNGAPTVVITSPVNNTTYVATATITINATAIDDGSIAKVEFYNGATKLGESTTAPYSFTWSNVVAGTYSITAKAFDNLNLSTTSAAVSVKVNTNQLPSITVQATSTTPTSVNLSATVSDGDGTIGKVEFFNGTTKIGEVTSAPYDFVWSGAPIGIHTITAVVTDDKGGTTTSSPITVTVNANSAPVASITSPVDNFSTIAPASIDITATASDADGTINRVEFYNGTTKLGESTTSPYAFNWTNVATGLYEIRVVAYDDLGAQSEDKVNVEVNDKATSIWNSESERNLAIYPNPTKDVFYVNSKIQEVVIYTMMGIRVDQIIMKGKNNVDLTSYASGIYLIELKSDEKSMFVKVAKE